MHAELYTHSRESPKVAPRSVQPDRIESRSLKTRTLPSEVFLQLMKIKSAEEGLEARESFINIDISPYYIARV